MKGIGLTSPLLGHSLTYMIDIAGKFRASRIRRAATGFLVCLAAVLAPHLATAEDYNTTVKAGQRTLVGQFATFRHNMCFAGPLPTWQMGRQPQNGTLQIVTEFSVENIPGCGQHRIGLARVYYTSKPGYRGKDSASVDFFVSSTNVSPVVNVRRNYIVTVE